jgi:hypothetical protein
MIAPSEFDAAASPLSHGVTVLEASAGTGKTFAIAALWLRMVLELEIPQERILVLTYTDAAASELRSRIHQRLVDASQAVDGESTADPFLNVVLDRCRRSDSSLRGASRRLAQARADFDEAPIGTIHGFCHRVQRGRAFEAGASFAVQLNPNTVARDAELVRDWWMLQMSGASGILVTWAALQGKSTAELTALVGELDRRPGARRIDGAPGVSLSVLADAMNRSLLRLQELWRRDRDTLHPFLIQRSTWVGSKGGGIKAFKAGGPALKIALMANQTSPGWKLFGISPRNPSAFMPNGQWMWNSARRGCWSVERFRRLRRHGPLPGPVHFSIGRNKKSRFASVHCASFPMATS